MTATTTAKKPHRWLWRSLIILVVGAHRPRGGVQHLRVVGPARRAVGVLRPTRASCPAGGPGTIIRSEDGRRPARRPGRPAHALHVHRSRAARRSPCPGVVVTPTGEPPPGGWPIIAWAHGTTGVDRRCAPSIDYPDAGLVRVPEVPRPARRRHGHRVHRLPRARHARPAPVPGGGERGPGRARQHPRRPRPARRRGVGHGRHLRPLAGRPRGGVGRPSWRRRTRPTWTWSASRRWPRRPTSARCSPTTTRRSTASC